MRRGKGVHGVEKQAILQQARKSDASLEHKP